MIPETPWITTYTGELFPLSGEGKVKMEDIAHSLSAQIRYMGHIRYWWSVAQHCLFVHDMMISDGYSEIEALYGLLHDAHEAYIGDIPYPLKRTMPGDTATWLNNIEAKLDQAIYRELKLDHPTEDLSRVIKWYDLVSLIVESKQLFWRKGGDIHVKLTITRLNDMGVAGKPIMEKWKDFSRYSELFSRIYIPGSYSLPIQISEYRYKELINEFKRRT